MKRTFVYGLIFLLFAGLFTMACENNERLKTGSSDQRAADDPVEEIMPYNAILGLGGDIRFKEDFLEANMTYGAISENGVDEISPVNRTYILTEKAHLDEVFSVYPVIDFGKDMVVMYAFTTVYGNRTYKITNITLDKKNLKIEFKMSEGKPGYKDARSPYTSHLVIKIDKLDIEAVEFKLLNP